MKRQAAQQVMLMQQGLHVFDIHSLNARYFLFNYPFTLNVLCLTGL